jgi:hypothetical protein
MHHTSFFVSVFRAANQDQFFGQIDRNYCFVAGPVLPRIGTKAGKSTSYTQEQNCPPCSVGRTSSVRMNRLPGQSLITRNIYGVLFATAEQDHTNKSSLVASAAMKSL